ncbi:MAG: glutamate 5-kinase, partial [Phenylobacterium sp.]
TWDRIVIKIGSALIAPGGEAVSGRYLLAIAHFITECRNAGKEVILVSSGSVAAGRHAVNSGDNIPSIAKKQAMAAVGQMKMMANWQRFFDFPCAQVLLTHDDLRDRRRYVNIKNTIRELLANQILPVVNENDTVATQELKVGDNDNLAALVALVSEADGLVICSDIDGLFNKDPKINPGAELIPLVEQIDDNIYALAGGTTNKFATGGMLTKIQAADNATAHGIDTLIINGFKRQSFEALIKGQTNGTLFKATKTKTKAKKHWLRYTLKAKGQIMIDHGAVNALKNKGASLLSSGIIAITSQWVKGEAVDVVDQKSNKVVARGIVQYDSQDLDLIKGCRSNEIAAILGYCPSEEVIHRDDLALLE